VAKIIPKTGEPLFTQEVYSISSFLLNLKAKPWESAGETSGLSAFMKMNTIKLYLAIGDEKSSKSINHNEKI
jgi:hypothetical protein